MPAESAVQFEALEAQAGALMDLFKSAGYEPVAPSILQPAGVFLDSLGESLRGRTYVFSDLDGEELCLRPDLTVPACRLYLERHPEADATARYCYNGPAFRYQARGQQVPQPRTASTNRRTASPSVVMRVYSPGTGSSRGHSPVRAVAAPPPYPARAVGCDEGIPAPSDRRGGCIGGGAVQRWSNPRHS